MYAKRDMQVQQVAYDRYLVVLPPADADWRPLSDPETLAETSAWLWEFGPTPLVGVVGHDGTAPGWTASWSPRAMKWAPEGTKSSVAVVIESLDDLGRFLREGAPHDHTVLMWPRVSPAKTFEALNAGANAWKTTVDAVAMISKAGERLEVEQVA